MTDCLGKADSGETEVSKVGNAPETCRHLKYWAGSLRVLRYKTLMSSFPDYAS